MRVYNINDFGAEGDGKFDNAQVIQKIIDKCSAEGGGKVIIPGGGIFISGPFNLKSNIEFHVEANAVLRANPDELVYTQSAFRENYGEGSIWIGGQDAENIIISGQGVIDGNGVAFMGPEEKAAYVLKTFDTFDRRPHVFTPINCKNLIIKDVTFKDSAYWCIHLVGCEDIVIQGIRIFNNLKIRNSDGIDIDHSRNVRISDCYIESGDDCISPKTRREYEEYGPTANVTISNCILKSTSCSIKIGSENMDAVRDVTISNCIISSSNRGIGIQNRDEGIVENVIFENIIIHGRLFDDVWWGKAEPIYVTAFKRQSSNARDANWRFAKGQMVGKVGKIRNITFSNIISHSENGIYVGGEEGKVNNIRFNNVNVYLSKTTEYKGGLYDLRPSDTIGILKADTAGFYLNEAAKISLTNCSVEWGTNLPNYFGSSIFASQIKGLKITNFDGEAAFPDEKDPMKIENCTDLIIN